MAYSCYLSFQHDISEHDLTASNNWLRMKFNDANSLAVACSYGHLEIIHHIMNNSDLAIRRVLTYENKQDIFNEKGIITIRHINAGLLQACINGHVEVVEFMISAGATNMTEVRCNTDNAEINDILLSYDTTSDLHTFDLCLKGRLDFARKHIMKHLTRGLDGACQGGHLWMVNEILAMGATVDTLYYACRGGNLNIVQGMISRGATDWDRAFEGACEGGNVDVLRIVEGHGVGDWNQCIEIASENGQLDLVNLALTNGADIQLCHSAFKYGWQEIIDRLLTANAVDINMALEYACDGGQVELINRLIDMGADSNGSEAFKRGDMEIVRLIHSRCHIDEFGIFMHAADYDQVEVVEFMLQNGGRREEYPFKTACKHDNLEMIFSLLQRYDYDIPKYIQEVRGNNVRRVLVKLANI